MAKNSESQDTGLKLVIEDTVGIDPTSDDAARRQFRDTLGQFATGVTIMTMVGPKGDPIGITVSSFNSLSLDPPLILWSIAKDSVSFEYFRVEDSFAVNVLAEDQEDLAISFSKTGEDKYQGVEMLSGLDGVPLISGCVVYFECKVDARHPGGDHDIIIGRVRRIFNVGRAPLLFHGGALRAFGD